ALIPNATVTVNNTDTGLTRTVQTGGDGRYNFVNLPIGSYQVTVEAANFSKFVQTGIKLLVNQNAVVDVALRAGGVQEVVTVTENASLLNTTTAEVSTRFDEKRLSELPIATNRNVFNVLLSVPGISQLSSGQTGFANGISFSANGSRLRSNNFMIDGQDINDPSVSGGQIALNNPDAIQEVRIITNQFLAEYGRNSGSVVNFIGKSGTNNFHGSAFIFHNNDSLNSCSNLDKRAGFCNPSATDESKRQAPTRKENQFGFTFGGPLTFLAFGEGGPKIWSGKDRTFFFGDYQRWTDRQLGSGFTLRGAPTEAGRTILQNAVGNRPQVAALLRFLPAGAANGLTRSFTANGQTFVVPIGDITGSSSIKFDDGQGSFRLDHRISDKNLLYGRYRFDSSESSGAGQVTPPGLTTISPTKTKAAVIVLNTILSSRISNEARVGWSRFDSVTNAADPSSEAIPSIEVTELGLTGFNAAASRTAIGLAVNLPQFRINDTYQIQESLSYTTGNHNLKFGVDLRRTDVKSFFIPTVRGRLAYTTLQNFVDDIAQTATINLPLRGGDRIGFYRWYEYYTYIQDEWRIKPNFTLTLGLRYEYPGDSFSYLKEANTRVVAANGGDSRFALTPVPTADKNNFMPRIGFNWNPITNGEGILGFITGGDKLVLRGGYSRTYDANYINLNLNIAGSFPYLASITLPTTVPAFATLTTTTVPNISNPNILTRTVVAGDFRSPATDQYSLEIQRSLTSDMVMKVGYIRTRGTGLFQTVDGNPRVACPTCNALGRDNNNAVVPIVLAPRVDPTRGVIRLRGNRANSIYNALQVSLEKRLSRNFSAGINYTYSSFIDTASETFNPSNAEVAVAQDSFNLEGDRARSSFDRPHRLSGNVVYQLPFFDEQNSFVGRLLGGFQVNSFFTIQSGAPFTVLNGEDPSGALSGIDGLVGNAIRPNLNTTLDLSSMTIPEIVRAGGASLFRRLSRGQERVGDVGRNTLRAQRLTLVDFGIIKNTRIAENLRIQLRADMFNVLNHRNFGVPEGRINAPNFLDEGGTNGGNRRIILGARFVF
ncbi:MAG: carboxypeptidase regulatory-like domain-containing protein, partial [Acidobacteriota bacterium]|nr:carboxypeptidase regulatory-like domain-containing protein [Acidobacteriota bacterium]